MSDCKDIFGLDEIRSEYIEPYLIKYLTHKIENVGREIDTPAEAKADIQGVKSFVDKFCGIHARMVTDRRYLQFIILDDDKLIEICKNAVDKLDKSEEENQII